MDSTSCPKEARERTYRRAPSRASTSSTINTQMTTKSASSSSSHPRTTTPSNAPNTHRYHHSQCEKDMATTRSPSRLTSRPSYERQRMTPVSSLLQEKLQQERQAESERLASRSNANLSASTGDMGDRDTQFHRSGRYTATVERRPSSSHDDSTSSQNSMGAKQMEKAMSTLHKQNFDLKLELFHRREKQTSLEARVQTLEIEVSELKDRQKLLTTESEQKDKALQEAVTLIVRFEAHIDSLLREKELRSRIEGEDAAPDLTFNNSGAEFFRTTTPSFHDGDVSQMDLKAIARMPSFLSERSAQTENLRNVVLQSRGSLLHMRKVSEVSASSAEVSELNRVASPSLSLLSESSFVSIYGSKDGHEESAHVPHLKDSPSMDGAFDDRSPTPTTKTAMNAPFHSIDTTPRHLHNARTMAKPGQELGNNNAVTAGSPLRRLEKPRGSAYVENVSRPSTSGRARAVVTPTPGRQPEVSRPLLHSKPDKRQQLQSVVTNCPAPKDLANSHVLPPTPDTVSSSVLRRHNNHSNSQDSLPSLPRQVIAQMPGFAAPRSDNSERRQSTGVQQPRAAINARMSLNTALPAPDINADLFAHFGDLARSLPQRPRSAAETTISHTRTQSLLSDSESDTDGGADAHSDTDSNDYWMRESYKPNKNKGGLTSGRVRPRSPSPDLFSFPGDSGGWEPDAMFGALKGVGFLGSPAAGLKRDPIDEMAASLQTAQLNELESMPGQLPVPQRRSSNSNSSNNSVVNALSGKSRNSPAKNHEYRKTDSRTRSNSVDYTGREPPPRPQADGGPAGKRNQYPPIAGLQSRGRGLGLNMLFRRSGSESHGAPLSATEPTFPPVASYPTPALHTLPMHLRHLSGSHLSGPSGRSSVPPPASMPWTTHHATSLADDFQSATPPPIQRKRAPPPLQIDALTQDATQLATSHSHEAEAATTPTTATMQAAPVAPASGGKRKWLGLGKMGGLMNRTG
ncbi:hypothetical protein GGR57DRAFT_362937 [Xylariaceae sp. FL1272]|nr:hypothetical protein GGR57DRAFT_362937 [Xylariaceae sp. FL1272]